MKAKLEAIWNDHKVRNIAHVSVWTDGRLYINGRMSERAFEGLHCSQGEERAPSVGKSAEKFMRRVRKHWGPAPMSYCGDAKLKMPDWVRANYKRNCPNNYKTLIAEYGSGVTKLDQAVRKLIFFEAFGHDPRNGD